MEKDKILKKIFTKKTKDYSFSVLFFLIFTVFLFFAIRPSLTTAFSLTKEEVDLKEIDILYEKQISNIVNIQSQLEENRDKLFLFDQAIGGSPQVNKMVEDIKGIADLYSFTITKINIGEINLMHTKNQSLQSMQITMEGYSDFEHIMSFLKSLFNQRRLKTINKISISRPEKEQDMLSISNQLIVKIIIEGYYE